MPFYPVPLYGVGLDGGVDAFPEVGVFEGFFVGFCPASAMPAIDPAFVHGVEHVAGV